MGKYFSRCIALILIIMLVFSSFTGCGGARDEEANTNESNTNGEPDGTGAEEPDDMGEPEVTYDFGGRSITYAAYWDPEPKAGASEGEDKLIARVQDMEEKYNFKMEYLNIPADQFVETFTASTLAGDPFAEVAEVQNTWFFPGLVSNGFCYPVSDLGVFDFSEEKWNQFMLEVGTYNGKRYGFNTGRIFPRGGLYWNRTLFEREGLPNLYELQASKEWTWDKMLEIALKATKDTDGDGKVDQWGLIGQGHSPWPFVYSNNGRLLEVKDGKPIFRLNEPNAIEALQYIQDLIIVHKVMAMPPAGAEWDWAMTEFKSGKIAMAIGEWWETDRYREMEDDYGFVVFPMGPRSDQYTSVMSMENLKVMPATVEKPEEVAIVWDEYTDPFPDEDPDAWKEDYEKRARDPETIHTAVMISDGKEVRNVMNYATLLAGLSDWRLAWDALAFIGSGEKTAKVAIEEIAQEAQSILEDAFSAANE